MTEDQIIDLIIDRYLEKHPRKEYYGVKLATCDRDIVITYYHDLSEKERELVRTWMKEKDEWDSMGDFLSSVDGGNELEQLWLDVINPYDLEKVEDCSLNDMLHFTDITVHVLGKNGTIERQFPYTKSMNDDEFRQIVKLSIIRDNQLSANMLTLLMPEFATEMMRHIIVDYNDGVCDISKPFCVEMTEIRDIVDSIMNPKKDELELFDDENKEIRNFMLSHAIVPNHFGLFEEKTEKEYVYVNCYFDGRELIIDPGRHLEDSLFLDNEDERFLKLNANKFCDCLDLSSYDELVDYLKEHFNTKTAFDDICKLISDNCPDAIIMKK